MNEKVYKTMKQTGAGDITLGIITIVAGITLGVMAIINGARLLHDKSDIMF